MKEIKLLIDAQGETTSATGIKDNVSNLELIGIYDLLANDEFNKKRKASKVVLYVRFDDKGFFITQKTQKGDITLSRIYEALKSDAIKKINHKFVIRKSL